MEINLMDITEEQVFKLCDENIIDGMLICDDCQLLEQCHATHGRLNLLKKIEEIKRFSPLLDVEVEI